jgi:hypothetical protein
VLALSGGLLIAPWVLFSLLAGIGRPDEATHIENQSRFLILLINSILVLGGLVMLRQALIDAGDRIYSNLGLIFIGVATPLYLVWSSTMIQIHRVLEIHDRAEVPDWINATTDYSDMLLFFGGLLTYFATAAFAASLGQSGWIGRNSSRLIIAVSIGAAVCLTARGLRFPEPAVVFAHWYSIPGWIAGIPAIPWIMPCLIGVSLLKRAGSMR